MAELHLVGREQREEETAAMTNIQKMQLAVQIAALVRASFVQPTDSDVRDSHAYGATRPDRQPDRDRQYVSGESAWECFESANAPATGTTKEMRVSRSSVSSLRLESTRS